MAKERICTGCEHNNNGWCKAKETNKGLRDLVFCEDRRDNKIGMVERLIDSKCYEHKINPSDKLIGEINGLRLALSIMKG